MHEYRPAPLDGSQTAAVLIERNLDHAGLRDFLARHGQAPAAWPPEDWTLGMLTLAAMYFHPEIAVARAEWRAARAAEITAGRRRDPDIAPLVEYHSDEAVGEDGPWAIGIAVDIPLITGDIRAARLDRARARAEALRLGIGEVAWRVRAGLRDQFVASHGAERAARLWRQALDARQEAAALLDARFALGETSSFEARRARTRLDEARLALAAADGRVATARAGLAGALGVPVAAIDGLVFDYGALTMIEPEHLMVPEIRRAALGNRLDVRVALARYATAEAALRVAVERQYPDVVLSPGLLWDQGDLVWSLGSAVLAPLFDRHRGPIAEAEAARALVAAQFTALQGHALAEVGRSVAAYRAEADAYRTARDARDAARRQYDQAARQVAQGESNRMDAVQARIELLAAEQRLLGKRLDVLNAWGSVENAVQRPLDGQAPAPENLERLEDGNLALHEGRS
ncbi:MAG: TolC family protein [Alphaproteobacteria bacterium]|nr:TolC family protein [Alphaproteobacteria bacterium]MDP6518242.1 TolC family protein [Alphaproteobacteria bacterium]